MALVWLIVAFTLGVLVRHVAPVVLDFCEGVRQTIPPKKEDSE